MFKENRQNITYQPVIIYLEVCLYIDVHKGKIIQSVNNTYENIIKALVVDIEAMIQTIINKILFINLHFHTPILFIIIIPPFYISSSCLPSMVTKFAL